MLFRSYPTDALAGALLGVTGYWLAKRFENSWRLHFDPAFGRRQAITSLLHLAVFAWIFEVAVEFRDVQWLLGRLR